MCQGATTVGETRHESPYAESTEELSYENVEHDTAETKIIMAGSPEASEDKHWAAREACSESASPIMTNEALYQVITRYYNEVRD